MKTPIGPVDGLGAGDETPRRAVMTIRATARCRYCSKPVQRVSYLDASDPDVPPVEASAWLYTADGVSSVICPAREGRPPGSDRNHRPHARGEPAGQAVMLIAATREPRDGRIPAGPGGKLG